MEGEGASVCVCKVALVSPVTGGVGVREAVMDAGGSGRGRGSLMVALGVCAGGVEKNHYLILKGPGMMDGCNFSSL